MLGLVPHPVEGGFFARNLPERRTSPPTACPPARRPRALGTAIYYLLTPETFSAMHRLASDEVFHFYLGDPVEMLQLWPDGPTGRGGARPDLRPASGRRSWCRRGVWQGARLSPRGRLALLGTTVAPGFDYADYEIGDRAALLASHPGARDLVTALTRPAATG